MLGIIAFLAGFLKERFIMFISRRNPITARALKRRPHGTIAFHHNGVWEDVEFVRVHGGWKRSRTDVTSETTKVVSSATVADECNHAFGCKESWAEIY